MRGHLLIILLIVIVALVPAWLFNRYMQKLIQPRRSFAQLFLYFLVILVFVAAYTFMVVYIIMQLFPVLPAKA